MIYFKLIAGAGMMILIGLYIWNAESNKKALGKLENQIEQYIQNKAEEDVIIDNHIKALESILVSDQIREKKHAENIKIIQNSESGECINSSPPIIRALSLLHEQRYSISEQSP